MAQETTTKALGKQVIVHPKLHIACEINEIPLQVLKCNDNELGHTYTSIMRSSNFLTALNEAESNNKAGSAESISKSLLFHLQDIPPLALFFEAQFEDQVGHWVSAKRRFLDVYSDLASYFGGFAPFPPCSDNPKDREIAELMGDDYIALYGLIHRGWDSIFEGFQKIDYPLNSPGETLLEIISMECAGYMSIVFPDIAPVSNSSVVFSPSELYRLRGQYQKLQSKRDPPSKDFLKKFERHFGWQAQWGFFLRDFCVYFAEKNARGKKSSLRQKIVHYRQINSRLWDAVFSQWHPRRNLHGYLAVHGKKRTAPAGGRAYTS